MGSQEGPAFPGSRNESHLGGAGNHQCAGAAWLRGFQIRGDRSLCSGSDGDHPARVAFCLRLPVGRMESAARVTKAMGVAGYRGSVLGTGDTRAGPVYSEASSSGSRSVGRG